MHRVLSCVAVFVLAAPLAAQTWVSQPSGTSAEFRSLSVVNARIAWAGGKNGTWARTVDGGRTWRSDTIPGASGLFFIGAHAASAEVAYLLGTSFVDSIPLARIYKTVDGGRSWRAQYQNATPGVFFDGLAFWDADHGIAFGDPVDGSFLVLTTSNGGRTWERVPPERLPAPLPGEAAFAASGTAITTVGRSHVWIGTGGGAYGRVLYSSDRGRTWSVAETPIAGGKTAGIFSLAFTDARNGVALGGDYARPREAADAVARTTDGGRTWTLAGQAQPDGVRYGGSFIRQRPGAPLVAVGPSGSGYSRDGGSNWVVIDTVGFNSVRFVDGAGWAVGVGGRIATFVERSEREAREGAHSWPRF